MATRTSPQERLLEEGADDDITENEDHTDRQTEAGDMAIMMALELIKEIKNIMLYQAATWSSS